MLALPDVPQAFVSSFVGRIPIGIAGLAILLLVQSTEGSYAQAGVTGATYVAGLAAAAPLLGRMIDRLGRAAYSPPARCCTRLRCSPWLLRLRPARRHHCAC
ncbi:MAG: hypothetical protein ABI423_01935 [Burkholderiales bacterium]